MRNKRKGILMACAILGSAAIVSTGFAAWVVTVNETETFEGNIQVDEVQDKTHLITVLDDAKDLSVYFGKTTKKPEATKDWLTNDTERDQDLKASFKVQVTNYETANLDISVSTPDGFDVKEDNKRLLADPLITYTEFDPISEGSKTGQLTVTITFAWGDYFGGENPINFYNTKEATASIRGTTSYAADAVIQLTEIHKINAKAFTVTLETTDGAGTVSKS